MGLEALSCAIAEVIHSYHAQKTNPTLPSSEHPKTLEEKISEATHGNNTRLTLLQYMHFGFTLSESARLAKCSDEIDVIKPQLVQFIQNIQSLLITTSTMFTHTLTFSTIAEENFTIYLLDNQKTTASKLIHTLLETLELAPDSTQASIQATLDLRFQHNSLKTALQALQTNIISLERELDNLAEKQSTLSTMPSSPAGTTLNTEHEHEADDWESVPDAPERENNHLIIQNEKLSEHIEEAKERIHLLEDLIFEFKKKQEKLKQEKLKQAKLKQEQSRSIADESLAGLYHRTKKHHF